MAGVCVAAFCSFTSVRFLLCPAGPFLHSLREAFLLCPAGVAPLGACSPPLAARRDSLDRDPAARPEPGPLGVREGRRHRHPVPVRALGPRGLGRHGRRRPPGGLNAPHPQRSGTNPFGRVSVWRSSPCRSPADGRVVAKSAPRATGAPRRSVRVTSGRLAVGNRWRRFIRTARGPPRASLLGRTRRRVGGLGSRPNPSDRPGPAGQKESLRQ